MLGGLYIGAKHGIIMELFNDSGSHFMPINHIAIPMHIAYNTAFSENTSPVANRIGLLRCNLSKNESPCPSDSGMTRGVRAIILQKLFITRCANWFLVHEKRTRTLVLLFSPFGRIASICFNQAQQLVKMRCVLLSDRGIQRTGEGASRFWEVQVCILPSQFPTRRVAQIKIFLLTFSSSARSGKPAAGGGGRRATLSGSTSFERYPFSILVQPMMIATQAKISKIFRKAILLILNIIGRASFIFMPIVRK